MTGAGLIGVAPPWHGMVRGAEIHNRELEAILNTGGEGYRGYRLSLTRCWLDTELKGLLFIGAFPGLADRSADDPLTARMMAMAHRWGYGDMTVANVYPLISTNPGEVHRWAHDGVFDGALEPYTWLETNRDKVMDLVEAAQMIVCCWGAGMWGRPYFRMFLDYLQGTGKPLHCLDVAADGGPCHPLARGKYPAPADGLPLIWPAAEVATAKGPMPDGTEAFWTIHSPSHPSDRPYRVRRCTEEEAPFIWTGNTLLEARARIAKDGGTKRIIVHTEWDDLLEAWS